MQEKHKITNGEYTMVVQGKKEDPLRTNQEFSGFLKKCLEEEAEELGLQPGQVVKMIVHQHYKKKAA